MQTAPAISLPLPGFSANSSLRVLLPAVDFPLWSHWNIMISFKRLAYSKPRPATKSKTYWHQAIFPPLWSRSMFSQLAKRRISSIGCHMTWNLLASSITWGNAFPAENIVKSALLIRESRTLFVLLTLNGINSAKSSSGSHQRSSWTCSPTGVQSTGPPIEFHDGVPTVSSASTWILNRRDRCNPIR